MAFRCKYAVAFPLCISPAGQTLTDSIYEVRNCLESNPECRKERTRCRAKCGGNATEMPHDFFTSYSKAELSPHVLGAERMRRGRANCSVRSAVLEVDLFGGQQSEAFRRYSARLRTRGGFAAISPTACKDAPKSCAAIQRALEKAPTLTWLNGKFVAASEIAPPPPPSPALPPPRLQLYTTPHPPSPPPPPPSPSPWHTHSESGCIPLVTPAEAGIVLGAEQEERAVCLYARSFADERLEASRCFAPPSPMPPPPPPAPELRLSALASALLKRRVKGGGTNGPEPAQVAEDDAAFAAQHGAQHAALVEHIDRLSAQNFQLRGLLDELKERLLVPGRRLFQRSGADATHELHDAVVATASVGRAPLLDVSIAQCMALCTALDNATIAQGRCAAIAFKRQVGSLTMAAACYLLHTLGSCDANSFSGAVYARRDTSLCDELPRAESNPFCLELASDRQDLRVLDWTNAASACRHGKGRPQLPQPRSSLEAFSFVGHARERGVKYFWAERQTGETHWAGLDGKRLAVPTDSKRCILVGTPTGDLHAPMFASLQPCEAKLADGVVCETISVGPPSPPPDAGARSPPPPPPPVAYLHSLRAYVRETMVPITEAICEAGLVEVDLARLCLETAARLSAAVIAGSIPSLSPLCTMGTGWHSCAGDGAQDRDGFETCRDAHCADDTAAAVLRSECPAEVQPQLERTIARSCAAMASPAPPPTPAHPPPPPRPPRTPPPLASAYGELRIKDDERPTDPDCAPITYSSCKAAAVAVGAALSRPTTITVSLAACDRSEVDLAACFIGCALTPAGAIYHYLPNDKLSAFLEFNSKRCAAAGSADHCVCAWPSPPSPASPTLQGREDEYAFSGVGGGGAILDGRSHGAAYYKRVATDAALPTEFASTAPVRYVCEGGEMGGGLCAQHCGGELGGLLRAFSVTGQRGPAAPPSPPPPPPPPAPSPSPSPPGWRWLGASESCYVTGTYLGPQCRDGGPHSLAPTLCTLGTQARVCGPRVPEVRNGDPMPGDDSCGSVNGVCEDGLEGALGYEAADGTVHYACAIGTDATDCPNRYYSSVGPLSYGAADAPPYPIPPSPSPHPPPPPRPPFAFESCNNTCADAEAIGLGVCSDGHAGSFLIGGTFRCLPGQQCAQCGPRTFTTVLTLDSSVGARNGVCQDPGAFAETRTVGWGEDTADCGPRPVVFTAGAPPTTRRRALQELGGFGTPPAPPMESFYPGATQAADGDYLLFLEPPSPPAPPSPLPPSPFPPPSPLPPADLNQCECACYGEEEGAAAGQDEWTDVALAAATVPQLNTNLYTAYAVLARGAVVPTDAQVHVYGMSGLLQRAVHAPALSAPVAEAERGWRLNATTLPSMRTVELLRLGTRPDWATDDVAWRALPEASADPDVWRDYCVGECFASVSDALLLHLVQVDLSASTAADCNCYSLGSTSSPEPPDDLEVTELVRAHGQRAQHVRLYTVGAPPRFAATDLPGLGGTAFHAPAYEAGLELQGYADDLGSPAASVGGCALECARTRGGGMIRGVAYDPTSQACGCVLTELYGASMRAVLLHTGSASRLHVVEWCPGVEPAVEAQDGALVWSKERQRWCRGVVAHRRGEAVIGGAVLAQVTGRAASCAASCANDTGCLHAEVLGVSFASLSAARIDHPAPPPSPDAPGPAPPPVTPPVPPGLPKSGTRFRVWQPESPDPPQASPEDGLYEVRCGVGFLDLDVARGDLHILEYLPGTDDPTSLEAIEACGAPLPLFRGDYASALELARALEAGGSFSETLCAYECAPSLSSHELSAADELTFRAGGGLAGLQLRGAPGVAPRELPGQTVVQPAHTEANVTRARCATLAAQYALLGSPLALWARPEGDNLGYGDCLLYRVVASPVQRTLWSSYLEHASRMLDLAHFRVPLAATTAHVPDADALCGIETRTCLWWSAFDADTYACRPQFDLSNVLTPLSIMDRMVEAGVGYPPPSPPAPAAPAAPSPPPPPPQQCLRAELPQRMEGAPTQCFRWATADAVEAWPPLHTHGNVHELDDECPSDAAVTLKIRRDLLRQFNPSSLVDTPLERINPSGGLYPNCAADTAENECCVAPHTFVLGAAGDGQTGCEQRCAMERRFGRDASCLPAYAQCLDPELDPSNWPAGETTRHVEVLCLCGARGEPVDALPPSAPPTGRRLADGTTIDARSGGHLNASAVCRRSAMEWKLRWMPPSAPSYRWDDGECALEAFHHNYLLPEWHEFGAYIYCDYIWPNNTDNQIYRDQQVLANDTQCCLLSRARMHVSRLYRHPSAPDNPHNQWVYHGFELGQGREPRHYSPAEATLVVGDADADGLPDALLGNDLYINTRGASGESYLANAEMFHADVRAPPNTPFTIGTESFARAHFVQLDAASSYPDLAVVDHAGHAFILRSAVPHPTVTQEGWSSLDTTAWCHQGGGGLSPCKNRIEVYASRPRFHPGDRVRISALSFSDATSFTACTTAEDWLAAGTDLEVIDVELTRPQDEDWNCSPCGGVPCAHQLPANGGGQGQHPTCNMVRYRLEAPAACAGRGLWNRPNPWASITLEGASTFAATAGGQAPTYHPPQRVGDVHDVDVKDIAVFRLQDVPEGEPLDRGDGSVTAPAGGMADGLTDLCLLFAGRPIKCFQSTGHEASGFDTSTSAKVVYPHSDDACDDCTRFARFRGLPVGTSVPCSSWSYPSRAHAVPWTLRCDTATPHGLVDHQLLSISGWSDLPAGADLAYFTEDAVWGAHFRATVVSETAFTVETPFRLADLRTGTGLTFVVARHTWEATAGPVGIGGTVERQRANLIVVRSGAAPTVLRPEDGFYGHQFGVLHAGSADDAVYGLTERGGVPVLAVANADGATEVYAGDAETVQRVRTTLPARGESRVALCGSNLSLTNGRVDVVATGDYLYARRFHSSDAVAASGDFGAAAFEAVDDQSGVNFWSYLHPGTSRVGGIACADFVSYCTQTNTHTCVHPQHPFFHGRMATASRRSSSTGSPPPTAAARKRAMKGGGGATTTRSSPATTSGTTSASAAPR